MFIPLRCAGRNDKKRFRRKPFIMRVDYIVDRLRAFAGAIVTIVRCFFNVVLWVCCVASTGVLRVDESNLTNHLQRAFYRTRFMP